MNAVPKQACSGNTAIRPFQVNVPEAELIDLRKRINATKWPERETVADASQGVRLDTIQALARYWGKAYDWRTCEARLKALPQFITEIDGLDIHFIHVRSKHENALPLIIAHGWPGSIIEQLKIIEPLTNPTSYGGSASDAFHLVIPSMPGYGFSGRPTTIGWDAPHIARAWVVLMKRLGYTRFVAQGGDWGAFVVEQMGVQAAPELLGIHTNMACAVPSDVDNAALVGAPPPSGLSADAGLHQSIDQYHRALDAELGFCCDPPRLVSRERRTTFQLSLQRSSHVQNTRPRSPSLCRNRSDNRRYRLPRFAQSSFFREVYSYERSYSTD